MTANVTYTTSTKKTTTGQCEGCWEHTAATGDLMTCESCDQPTTVKVVGARFEVEGVDYGTREFFGDDAQAQAEAWATPLLAILKKG